MSSGMSKPPTPPLRWAARCFRGTLVATAAFGVAAVGRESVERESAAWWWFSVFYVVTLCAACPGFAAMGYWFGVERGRRERPTIRPGRWDG